MLTTIEHHLKRFKRDRRGISNIIVVALSLIIITLIVSNIVLFSYQMNQLDWEKIREDIKITDVSPVTRSSWFVTQSEYTRNIGTLISGNYTNTQRTDGSYERFSEVSTPQFYYPSAYGLLGSTSYLSGSLSNLQYNDGVYMIYRSYSTGTATSYNPTVTPPGYNLLNLTTLASGTVSNLASNDNSTYMTFNSFASAFSATSETRAVVGYRSNTGTNTLSSPKSRTWNGTAWSSESEMSTAGSPVRFVRVAYSPLWSRYYERVIVTLSVDGDLDAYVWTGSSWAVTNNIATVGTVANAYRPFDVEYEKTSGRALLVYFTNTANEIGYKIWNGTAWSVESTYNLVTSASVNVYWISLAQNPTSGSNELALVCIDATNSKAHALIWNDSSWVDQRNLTQSSTITATTTEDVAVAYEQGNGYANFAYATGTDAHVVRRTGTGIYTDYTVDLTGSQNPAWFSLKADPASNRLMLLAVDKTKKLATADWNPTAWGNIVSNHATTDTDVARPADVAWEPSGSKVLMVYGYASNSITYKTWTPGGGWSGITSISMTGATHPWIQLRRNPRSAGPKILGATLNSVNDLGSLKWDGTTLTGTAGAFSTDTNVNLYECFELEFQRFGNPSEYTSDVEFSGTSNTNIWSQVAWTVDSAWNTSGVTVTIQLYNWNTGYPPSGDGYLTYTSSATPNTDETKTQTTTTNPQNFRDASGNWKIKIKGVKSTSTKFQFRADWAEYRPTRAEYTSEVEFTGSSNTETWTQLVWTVDSAWTTSSVGVTLQLYNYTLGGYPTSGNGYMSYISSGTANTDETQNQTITQNPIQFRNATGNWKMKVRGVKTTTASFDFKADWILFKPNTPSSYQLDLNGTFTIDLSTYPLACIQTIEVSLRYRASDSGEKWYLKAYNWTALGYSDTGFNTTAGHTPTTGWDDYAVNVTSSWQSYVGSNGMMYVKLLDNDPDANSTTVDIDFLGVRAKINGTNFTFKNEGSSSSHLVSLWIINSTLHKRYDLDVHVSSADTYSYIRADISLLSGQYTVKAITEKGNTAVYTS